MKVSPLPNGSSPRCAVIGALSGAEIGDQLTFTWVEQREQSISRGIGTLVHELRDGVSHAVGTRCPEPPSACEALDYVLQLRMEPALRITTAPAEVTFPVPEAPKPGGPVDDEEERQE